MTKKMEEKPEFEERVPNGAHDLISKLYREIGISAVAALLEVNKDLGKARSKSIKGGKPNHSKDEDAA